MIEDLSLYSPMLGLQLLCTTGELNGIGSPSAQLLIRFPLQRRTNFVTLSESEKLLEQLRHYFADAIDQTIQIDLHQEKSDDSQAVARFEDRQLGLRSDGPFQIDLKRETLLRRIQELFETQHINTTALSTTNPMTPGEKDEYSEDDERDAENAE